MNLLPGIDLHIGAVQTPTVRERVVAFLQRRHTPRSAQQITNGMVWDGRTRRPRPMTLPIRTVRLALRNAAVDGLVVDLGGDQWVAL